MADILEAIKTRLEAVSGVTDLVGTRIYTKAHQNKQHPLIWMQRITGGHTQGLSGSMGHAAPLIQITAQAYQKADAAEVAEQVRLALDGWSGNWAGVEVQLMSIVNGPFDIDVPPKGGDDRWTHQKVTDYRASHQVATP